MNAGHEEITDSKIKAVWDEPVICRVEVDLAGWLQQLTGDADWEVYNEEEDDAYVSFAMRHGPHKAEVTLYHNGYAIVDVDGEALFDGTLTAGTSDWAHLSYYNAGSGEPITLN
ncbi:hypothetical protein MTYP_01371 [Methylophilaceae bacterium]|nr:hypothetical protein MTYP_01371 [Methylophilaceae bacterium]